MTDKELLIAAAKAAEVAIYTFVGNSPLIQVGKYLGSWNPLTNDGDAFKLAVRLNICVDRVRQEQDIRATYFSNKHNRWEQDFYDAPVGENEKLEVTRRAIVRAAAAIGEKA